MSLTPEQIERLSPNGKLLHLVGEAERRGDEETARELRKKVVYPADALLAAKINLGADWIRNEGLRTETAEKKYGKDWLDRDIKA